MVVRCPSARDFMQHGRNLLESYNMKPFWILILLMFNGVTSALSGIEYFTPVISYTLPGSGQLGAFPRYTIDRCADLCLETRSCISFEFDLFYEICYLSKFNRKNYNLVTSKTRNYYELHAESRNLVEPNIQEGKNEEFQMNSNGQVTANFEKKQNLADDKSKDKTIDSSINDQSQKLENRFHANSEQSSSKADASLPVNSPNLNPSGGFPENAKIGLNKHNSAASGVLEDRKTKGSVGRDHEDSQDNLIDDSVVSSNKQLPNLDRFGQEYKFQANRPTSFDNGNQNLPSDVNIRTKGNGIVQGSPHLTREDSFPVESMGVRTTKKNPFEDGSRKVHIIQGRLPFLLKGQGEGEIGDARNERPSAALNGNSRDFQISGNFYDEAPGELQDHTPSSYVPPIYPVSPDKCINCTFFKSFCFIRDQHDCNQYVECFKEVGGGVRAYARKCAFGLFWDTEYNVCGRSSEISCDADPCRDGLLESYPYEDNCAGYWRCEAARSVAGCCAEGYAYVEGSGCLPNTTCINECSRIPDYTGVKRKAKDKECHLKPFHEDRRYYLEFVPGHGMRPRPCSAGTIYNHTRCQCVIGSVEVTECEPEFYLDFNHQIADKSRNGLPLTVFDVYPQQGAGVFNNDSHIKIWRFSDANIGSKLTIHIKFKDIGRHRNQIEYLISNCHQYNRQKTSSVAIALNWRTREILMLIDTNKSEPKVLRLKYTPNQWENVTLNYDGEIFQAQLGQTVSERITLQGEIEPRPSGFVVGNCGHFPSFTGLIKEVQIYLCNP